MIYVDGRATVLNDYSLVIVGKKIVQGQYDFSNEWNNIIVKALQLGFTIPTDDILCIKLDMAIRAWIANGTWASLDIFYWFDYNDTTLQNFSRINWKNPESNLLTIGGSPSYTAEGWTGNGTNGYLDPVYNPRNGVGTYKWTLNNAGFGCVVSASGSGGSQLLGNTTTANYDIISNSNTVTFRINRNSSGAAAVLLSGNGYKYGGRNGVTTGRSISLTVETALTLITTTTVPSLGLLMLTQGAATFGTRTLGLAHFGADITNAMAQQIRTDYNSVRAYFGKTQVA